jgi:hypothetical protein
LPAETLNPKGPVAKINGQMVTKLPIQVFCIV